MGTTEYLRGDFSNFFQINSNIGALGWNKLNISSCLPCEKQCQSPKAIEMNEKNFGERKMENQVGE